MLSFKVLCKSRLMRVHHWHYLLQSSSLDFIVPQTEPFCTDLVSSRSAQAKVGCDRTHLVVLIL